MNRMAMLAIMIFAAAGGVMALGPGDLSGTWTAVQADVEEIRFSWYKAQLEFSTFLRQRLFESGEWDLRGDSLFLYGASGTISFRVSLDDDTLRLDGKGERQIYIKKEEWQDLDLFGSYTATSTLKGEDRFGGETRPYSVKNLGDGDPKTCWAEGVDGHGIGEKIYLMVQGNPKTLKIINGYGKSPELFAKNGRVKAFRATPLAAYMLPGDVTEVAAKYRAKRCGPPQKLEVKDLQTQQTIPMKFDWRAISERIGAISLEFEREFSKEIEERRSGCEDRYYQKVVLCLDIAEVYPGDKFEDTCISELEIE